MDAFVCAACSVTWHRKPTRGRVPKLCPSCRLVATKASRTYSRTCAHCGQRGVRKDARFCSRSCATEDRKSKAKPVQLEMKFGSSELGPLRQALAAGDAAAVIAALKQDTIPTKDGCWEWQRRTQDGYATIKVARKTKSVHRLMAEAKYGPLGAEPVHHRCANTVCINPDHLQPVTHRENVAEMLARRYYVQRIAELEGALASLDPRHPALAVARLAS